MEWADEARTTLIEQIALGMRETARWTGRAALSPRVAGGDRQGAARGVRGARLGARGL